MKIYGLSFLLIWMSFMILTGNGLAGYCEELEQAYSRCIWARDNAMETSIGYCDSISDEGICHNEGCLWWDSKNKCVSAVCHTDSNFSGMPNVSEFIMWKHETGRQCPHTSCNAAHCILTHNDKIRCDSAYRDVRA